MPWGEKRVFAPPIYSYLLYDYIIHACRGEITPLPLQFYTTKNDNNNKKDLKNDFLRKKSLNMMQKLEGKQFYL